MNRIFSRIALGVAFGLLSLAPADAVAQSTFTACRVPNVGAIYMIGVSGAPTACLDASHVEFSWTEGGAPGANSVTTDMIVDGTITAADFAVDAVDGAAIAPDAVGSTEILDASIQAVDIQVDAVTGAHIAPNAVGSTEILDASIQPADLRADAVLEPGIEFLNAPASNINPVLNDNTAATLTLSHPGSGYVVATGVGQILCSAAQAVSVDIDTGAALTESWTINPTPGDFQLLTKQEVFTVTGSSSITLNFLLAVHTADNCSYFRVLDFSAIYVPERY